MPDAQAGARLPRDQRTGLPISPWQSLPPLTAPAGVTAVAGHVLRLDGSPLPDVIVEIEGHTTQTDDTGRFLLIGPPGGGQALVVDARRASGPGARYGVFELAVRVVDDETTVLPYTIWMPQLDTANQVRIPSPTTHDLVVRTLRIPGFELHIPAGTVVRDRDGTIVSDVTVTPIPITQPPFPLPHGFHMFFTVQPGGAHLETASGDMAGAWVVYPSPLNSTPGTSADFWAYEPDDGIGWYRYGGGAVSADGRTIRPNRGATVYEFGGMGVIPSAPDPPAELAAAPGAQSGGEPVDLATGLFILTKTDLTVADVMPLVLRRTYRPDDQIIRPFGMGATHDYAIYLWAATDLFQEFNLVLPDSSRIHYVRTDGGTGYDSAQFKHTETPTIFYNSTIVFEHPVTPNNRWILTLRDGTQYFFDGLGPLREIRDRYGNSTTMTFTDVRTGQPARSGLMTKITSPKGRSITLDYDPLGRIIAARDDLGHTVTYRYDTRGRMSQVIDPTGGTTTYTYTPEDRIETLQDPRGIVYLTNEYYPPGADVGRVKKQTLADSTITYQFAYTSMGGRIVKTDITDPRGFLQSVEFNTAGYTVTDTRAVGQTEQQVTMYERVPAGQPGSNLVSTLTDPLNRVTTYDYDAAGNVQTLTRLAGTTDQVVSTFSYDPPFSPGFNRIRSIVPSTATTDGRVTVDYTGLTRTTITDARGKQTLIDYNAVGQPTAITDPLNHPTTFEYDPMTADLTAIVDPVMDRTTRGYDAVGRMLRQTDPRSRVTSFVPDSLNRLTAIGDAAGGATRFGYDPNGNLLSLTDALGHATGYHPNNMDQIDLRTDPLGFSETFHYDKNGNLDAYTDRKNQQTTFTYDGLNRRRVTSYLSDASSTTLDWDGGDRLLQVLDTVGGTITNTWTPRDRLLTQQTAPGTIINYTEYDTLDRLKRMTPPGQAQILYGYTPISQLASVQQGTQIATLGYDDAARRMTLTLPNTVPTTYGYDTANRLTSLLYGPAGSLGTLGYGYDPASNRTAVSGSFARTLLPAAVATSSYDAANRQLRARNEISEPDPIALPTAWEGSCSSSPRERDRGAGGQLPGRRD